MYKMQLKARTNWLESSTNIQNSLQRFLLCQIWSQRTSASAFLQIHRLDIGMRLTVQTIELKPIWAGHNIGHFDILFLERYHNDFYPGLLWSFGYRTLDLHSIAYAVLRKSLSHENICKELGLSPEPKPHNALAGALSECAAFKALFARMSLTE